MAVYLCDITAFDYWFGERATLVSAISYPVVESLADATAAAGEVPIARLQRMGFGAGPVHVLVPEHRCVRRSAQVIAHVWSGPYPDRSFVRIAPDVYVEAPAFCLMRCARRFSKAQLLLLCNQLCAGYRCYEGQLVSRPPLANVAEMRACAKAAAGMRGAKAVRAALPYVSEGAASPREAQVAAMLRLRPKVGGCGLPPFAMNAPIEPAAPGAKRRCADFLLPRRKILEYESEEFHTGAEKIGLDSGRRAELQELGYEVVTLTNWQLKRVDEFLAVANVLRRGQGLAPLPLSDAEFMRRHQGLRRELFGG